MNRVITISREFGSGGRTIGRKLAEKLGIPCYDSELINRMADETGFAKEYIKEEGEYAEGGRFAQFFSPARYGLNNQDQLWIAQENAIEKLAEEGPCIIVGRCADYILKDKADILTVFIHADMAFRAERIVSEYGEREDAPEKRLRDKDKRRATYYRYYTDMKWGKAWNYDICLDSGRLGIDKCVDILADLY